MSILQPNSFRNIECLKRRTVTIVEPPKEFSRAVGIRVSRKRALVPALYCPLSKAVELVIQTFQ